MDVLGAVRLDVPLRHAGSSSVARVKVRVRVEARVKPNTYCREGMESM